MTPTLEASADLAHLTARDLMDESDAVIRAGASIGEVAVRLLTGPSRHLVVVDDDGRCVGVVGPRHLAKAHKSDPRRDPGDPIEVLGHAPWVSLRPEDDLCTCARALVEHDLDAIPVLDANGRVLGLVTAHAIARAAADLPDSPRTAWEE